MVLFAGVLALFWGIFWAGFLQFVPLGRFLAKRRTWVTVVVGVGVDLGFGLLVVPFEYWWPMALVVALSGFGVVYRSLYNEQAQDDPEKVRLKNKVIWALEDVVALAMDAHGELEEVAGRLEGEPGLLVDVVGVMRQVMEIERLARDGRRGEYVEPQRRG